MRGSGFILIFRSRSGAVNRWRLPAVLGGGFLAGEVSGGARLGREASLSTEASGSGFLGFSWSFERDWLFFLLRDRWSWVEWIGLGAGCHASLSGSFTEEGLRFNKKLSLPFHMSASRSGYPSAPLP